MKESARKTTVNLDGVRSLEISVNESARTVVAELIMSCEKPVFIYAEKFDAPCNYLREAIKKGVVYLNGDKENYIVTNPRNFWKSDLYC